ncbi:MAG: transcription initiation factor IIB family protein [Candidatus Thorarchaeota archaeon]
MAYSKKLKIYDVTFRKEEKENCCAIPNIISSNGYNVCTNCGTTRSRVISYKPSMKIFLEKDINIKSIEPVHSLIGPRTIFKGNLDGKGNYLSPEALTNYKRLSKINRGLVSGLEKNLWIAIPKLNYIKTRFNLPNYVTEDAFRIYISAAKKKLTLGRSIDGILGVSLYFALKFYGIPIILEDLLSAFQISKKKFVYCYKAVVNQIIPKLNLRTPNFTPQKYINKFYEELDLSMNCRNTAIKLIEESKMKGLRTSGKDPKGIAAASLYLSSKKIEEFRTQKQICEIANISEITLRMRLKEIKGLI